MSSKKFKKLRTGLTYRTYEQFAERLIPSGYFMEVDPYEVPAILTYQNMLEERSEKEAFLDFIEVLYDKWGIEYSFDDLQIIEECGFECGHCGNVFADHTSPPIVHQRYTLCKSCNEFVKKCEECGSLFAFDRSNTTWMCDECFERLYDHNEDEQDYDDDSESEAGKGLVEA